jgi:DNA repair exonuclease SbcCD ATPase subunit
VDTIEIKRSEYDELKNAASRVDDLEKKVSTLEEAANKVPDLERKVEAEETAKKNAEKERDDLKKKVDEAEETARASELAKERLGNLGTGFKGKLGEFTRERLEEQAGKLSDEEWDARLKELEETAGVKRDEGGKSSENDDDKTTFSREETARANLGGGGGNGNGSEVAPAARRSVVAGLFGPKSSK